MTSAPSQDADIVREMFRFRRLKVVETDTRATVTLEIHELALIHVDALYNFARYLAGTATEADDLVQEMFARALRAATSFEAGTNVKAWLFRILRNVYLDRRRRQLHDPLHLAVEITEQPCSGDAVVWEPVDNLARSALAHVEVRELQAAVMSLDESYRTPLLLDLEGMTETEIAQVLGCRIGTVKSRLSRARAQLRLLLTRERRTKESIDGL